MELTEDQSIAMDWIGEQSNILTKEGKADLWKQNVRENKPLFVQGNPDLKGLTVYVIGAGPSIEQNVQELKNVSERGIIVCVDAVLRYLLGAGVRPEYCIMIDGSEKMVKMMDGCDTSGVTLVATPSACPQVIKEWKGDRFFVITPQYYSDKESSIFHLTKSVKATKDLKEGEELYVDENYKVDFGGLTTYVMCGGNVSTAAHHFALMLLKAQQVVFAGMDLAWKYESHHYAGHEHLENVRARTASVGGSHKDWNGEEVSTNLSLLAFKRWHEAMARQYPGSVVNASEGGILGIGQKGERLPFIEFLTLKEAVAKYTPKRA